MILVANLEKEMRSIADKHKKPLPSKSYYSSMYDSLWTFMERGNAISKLKSIFNDRKHDDGKLLIETLIDKPIRDNKQEKLLKKLGWASPQINSLFDILFDGFSNCIKHDGTPDGYKSRFLTVQTKKKGSSLYRFQLNWIILVAFNIYHNTKEESQKEKQIISICELIKNCYDAFIGWIDGFDTQSLIHLFDIESTGDTSYKSMTSKNIEKDIHRDTTLSPLHEAIQRKLCEIGTKEPRTQMFGQQFLKKGEGIRPSSPKAVAAPNAAAASGADGRTYCARLVIVKPSDWSGRQGLVYYL
jgi:hypothetical protein